MDVKIIIIIDGRTNFNNLFTAKLFGEIDHHKARSMRETIDSAAERNNPTVLYLDFGGVTFMDSSGIGLIMGRYRTMKLLGGEVRVLNIPPSMERMVELSGLSALKLFEKGCEKDEVKK